ncbi:MAG: hypothetical protein Q4A27_01055 [bacterium]|nr:hypothetical protein [bacterium]
MDILTSFAIIVLCAMIHASFHLSISVLTLLSGHTLRRERSHLKLVKLSTAFVFGVIVATILLFCALAHLFGTFYNSDFYRIIWAILIGTSVGTAFSVWIFYYKRNSKSLAGTEMWIPRGFAKFLNARARKTRHSAEAFSLGISSVLSEVIFIATPIIVAILATLHLTADFKFVAVVVYAAIANFPLFVLACLISGGTSIAQIQIWREKNKRFLQFVAGFGLLILAFVVFVNIFGANL